MEANFPIQLLEILRNESPEIVRWLKHGLAFVIIDIVRFSSIVLPKYFNHTRFSLFQRQLHLYGFKKISRGLDVGAHFHPKFRRDDPDKAAAIKRPKKATRQILKAQIISYHQSSPFTYLNNVTHFQTPTSSEYYDHIADGNSELKLHAKFLSNNQMDQAYYLRVLEARAKIVAVLDDGNVKHPQNSFPFEEQIQSPISKQLWRPNLLQNQCLSFTDASSDSHLQLLGPLKSDDIYQTILWPVSNTKPSSTRARSNLSCIEVNQLPPPL